MSHSTTFKCPLSKSVLIIENAENKGMNITEFINYSVDKNLPVKQLSFVKKETGFKKIGFIIPDTINERLTRNQESLSSDIRKIKKWQIILHCVLFECENQSQ